MSHIPLFFVQRCKSSFDFLRCVLRQCVPAQIIAAIRRSQTKRLLFALAFSVLLHLSPFVPGLFKFAPQEAGRQIVLQVSLQAAPVKPTIKTDRNPRKSADKKPATKKIDKKSGSPGPENILTGKSDMKIAPVKDESRPAPESVNSEQENHEARLIADPGAPVYPDEAVLRKLESCVLAAVYVSATGEVGKVAILHADIPGIFDASVIEAQTAAHYLPARAGNGTVASRVLAVVGFVLEPERHLNCAMQYADVARKINGLPIAADISPLMFEGVSRGK